MMKRFSTTAVLFVLTTPCWGADAGLATSTLINVRTINPAADGSFSRGSAAYLGSATGMTKYATNTRRTSSILSVSSPAATDGVKLTLVAGHPSAPWCKHSVSIFSVDQTVPTDLYSSSGGTTWTKRKTFAEGNIRALFSITRETGATRLLAWVGTGGVDLKPYYSDSATGTTWTACTTDVWAGAPFFSGLHQASNGTICAGTYWGVGTTCEIWRSLDYGVTWTKEHTTGVSQVTHFHSIIKHAGTGRWIADTGDNPVPPPPYRDLQFYSDNDGDSWQLWDASWSSPTSKVTRWLDTGDSARVYYVSDGVKRMAWLDPTTWLTGTTNRVQPIAPAEKWWDIAEVGGLYYASVECAGSYGSMVAMVYVSLDLVEWIPYYQCEDGEVYTLTHYAGTDSAGRLHWIAYRTVALNQVHVILSPAKLATRTGLYLQGSKTNLATATVSKCADVTDWTAVSGDPVETIAVDATTQFLPTEDATGCIKVSATGAGDEVLAGAYSPAIPVTAGSTYAFHAWVKGGKSKAFTLSVLFNDVGVTEYSSSFGLRGDGNWTEIVPQLYQAPAGSTTVKMGFKATPQNGGDVEFWIGCLQVTITSFVGEWYVGASAQSTDVFSYDFTPSTDWTHFFTIRWPSGSITRGAGSDGWVCTWWRSNDDYATLIWTAATRKWTLSLLDSAGPDPSVASDARYTHSLQREAVIRFCLRNSSGVMRLSIMDGQYDAGGAKYVEHLAAVTKTAPLLESTTLTVKAGNYGGGYILPQILSDIAIYGAALSDAEVEAIMSLGAWQRLAGNTGLFLFPP